MYADMVQGFDRGLAVTITKSPQRCLSGVGNGSSLKAMQNDPWIIPICVYLRSSAVVVFSVHSCPFAVISGLFVPFCGYSSALRVQLGGWLGAT
jgi:hypothetical protein